MISGEIVFSFQLVISNKIPLSSPLSCAEKYLNQFISSNVGGFVVNEVLDKVFHKVEEHEYYDSLPQGYVKGKTKYIVVTGTVMSGLGKGIFASSLAKLLQIKGLKVSIMKFDGYLNVDAGTLNPFRHGEVFVLDDGTEGDMDLGDL